MLAYFKMAKVKEEAEDFDDYCLSQWTNYEMDDIKMEDKKQNIVINIKRKIAGNDLGEADTEPKSVRKKVARIKRKRSMSSTNEENNTIGVDIYGNKNDMFKKISKEKPKGKKSIKTNNSKIQGQGIKPLELRVTQESLENAKVCDTVASMCQYKCKECEKVFINRTSIGRHFKRTKHDFMGQKNLNKYLVSVVAHKCHICSEKILCDKSVIRSHLRNKHNMESLKDYINIMNVRYEKLEDKKAREFSQFLNALEKKYEVTETVGNDCEYSCPTCDFSCIRWGKLLKHITTKSHGPILQPTKYVTKVTVYKCCVCGKLILCDKQIFCTHLEKHNMTTNCYKTSYGIPNSKSMFDQYHLKLKTALKGIVPIKPKSKITMPKDVLPNCKTTRSIGNLTFFKCLRCPKKEMSY